MKKIFALALVLFLTSAVSSFAANTGAPAAANEGKSLYAKVSAAPTVTTDVTATLIGKCSKGVYPGWNTDANGYALVTMHQSGNRAFGSAHNSTALYRSDTLPTAAPASADNGSFDTAGGWTAM